jgi:hypothetical protein
MRGSQSGRLTLSLVGKPQLLDEGELASMPAEAATSRLCTRLSETMSTREPQLPLILGTPCIWRSLSMTCSYRRRLGTRKKADDWPV